MCIARFSLRREKFSHTTNESWPKAQGNEKQQKLRRHNLATKTQKGGDGHEARSSPQGRVLHDGPREGYRLQGHLLVDTSVPLLPKRPGDQPYQGIKAFTGRLSDCLPRTQPPNRDRLLPGGGQIRHAEEP
jgi:hypothetical protein